MLVQLKILRDFVFVFVFFLARPATECVRSVIDFRSSFVSLLLVRFRRVADCHTNGNQSGKNRQMCKKDREEEGSEKEGGGNTHTKKSFSRGAGAVNGPIRNHFTRCHSSGSFNWCLGLIRLIWIPAGSLAPVQGSLRGSLCGPCSNAVGSGFSGFFSAGRRIDWKRIGSTLELTCQPFGSIK